MVAVTRGRTTSYVDGAVCTPVMRGKGSDVIRKIRRTMCKRVMEVTSGPYGLARDGGALMSAIMDKVVTPLEAPKKRPTYSSSEVRKGRGVSGLQAHRELPRLPLEILNGPGVVLYRLELGRPLI